MVTRTRPTKRRNPTAKYLAAYSAASPPATSQKKKTTKKKVTGGELSKEDTPVPPELRKSPPEYNLPTLMPIGEYAASGMLPSLSYDGVPNGVPTLPPINPPVGQYPLRNNRMPAATPPRVIGLRSDVFNPLDHTSPHHPLPPGSFIAAAATAVGSPDGKWYDGDEGKWDDDDADIDEGDNLHDDEGMSDGSEYKPPDGNDDSLFYSSEENKEFERELDEVACVIEYSDPKKARHGRRRTTVILGGPMRLNYEGMTD